MKKVLILGATGMLGSAIYGTLKDKYDLVISIRNKDKLPLLCSRYGEVPPTRVIYFDADKLYKDYLSKNGRPSDYFNIFVQQLGDVDYVVNALGMTIPSSLANPTLALFINGALPHILARTFGKKLIHITTDCVYNGKEGFPYDETSPKSPVDLYGLSKSIGEPTTCLTIRTSIIGRELEGFTGLLEWFLQQKGRSIKGFTNRFWNGITTQQFARVCDTIISNPGSFPETGLYHVFANRVSKYEMLLAFREKYKIDCEIVSDNSQSLNRTLATVFDFNSKLKIPPFNTMIEELN